MGDPCPPPHPLWAGWMGRGPEEASCALCSVAGSLPPPPPQPQCLSPWAPLPCLGRNNVGCQLALSMQGKRHNFSRLKAYRFFICFSQPGVSPLITNTLILGLSYSSSFFLAPNLNSTLGKSICKDRKPRTQHGSPALLASSSLAGGLNCVC